MEPKFLVGIDCIFSRKLFSVELDLKYVICQWGNGGGGDIHVAFRKMIKTPNDFDVIAINYDWF